MRGYFAIGIEGVSKIGNMGNLIRTAHGFGAAFCFAVQPHYRAGGASARKPFSDTAKTTDAVPYYEYGTIDEVKLPAGCKLVGVEICEDAVDLPVFRHPLKAAYILGSERYDLSEDIRHRCEFLIKIPTKFSLNVATAGAIVMYDRLIAYGKFPRRPVMAGGKVDPLPQHVRGKPKVRSGDQG